MVGPDGLHRDLNVHLPPKPTVIYSGICMSDYTSKYPLLALMDTLHGWAKGVRHEDFWHEGNSADYVNAIEDVRRQAKGLIVWMELKGLEEEAIRLEAKMEEFREAVWNFQHACDYASEYPPDDDDCNKHREEMAERAEYVAGCAEDLNDEIDSSIWEGFYDA